MRIKDALVLTALSLVLGWLLVDAKPTAISSASKDSTLVIDTIKRDTINDISGKRALFIGDSHTSAKFGWQHQLSKKTKKITNITILLNYYYYLNIALDTKTILCWK